MDKLSIYEVLSWVVPGTLLLGIIGILFPDCAKAVSAMPAPEAFKVAFLAALAIFVGQIAQAIASATEPLLHWTWGGRPSEIAMSRGLGDRYFPKDSGVRIRGVLSRAVSGETSDRSLFLYAMQRAEHVSDSKAKAFNAHYAYNRVMLTLAIVILVAFTVAWLAGAVAHITRGQALAAMIPLVALCVLLWHRTRQRAYYYVREVLLVAERLLAQPTSTK